MEIGKVIVVGIFSQVDVIKLKPVRTTSYSVSEFILPKCNIIDIPANAFDVYYFSRELFQWKNFRAALRRFLNRRMSTLIVRPFPPAVNIDYRGNYICMCILEEKVEADQLMSWLSTLGGGFSALGESIVDCAKIARKISLKQLAIAMKIGDPFAQSRCRLFYSISLIQTGKLRLAKHIIRSQYLFASKHAEEDVQLVRMCQGIWLRLQYEYKKRRSRPTPVKSTGKGNGSQRRIIVFKTIDFIKK